MFDVKRYDQFGAAVCVVGRGEPFGCNKQSGCNTSCINWIIDVDIQIFVENQTFVKIIIDFILHKYVKSQKI